MEGENRLRRQEHGITPRMLACFYTNIGKCCLVEGTTQVLSAANFSLHKCT